MAGSSPGRRITSGPVKRKIAIACLLGAAAGGLLLAPGCASPPGPVALQDAGYTRYQVDARALYLEECARCHGQDGRARTFHGLLLGAQNFTDTGWQLSTTDEEITQAIQTGPGAMPAFEKKLSSSEIAALAAYLRGFKPGPSSPL